MSLPAWFNRVDAERRSLGFDVLLAVALTVLLQLNVWFGPGRARSSRSSLSAPP
jgi:hypothetical protein